MIYLFIYGEGVTLPERVRFGLFDAEKHVAREVTIGEKCDVSGSKVKGGVKRGITGEFTGSEKTKES